MNAPSPTSPFTLVRLTAEDLAAVLAVEGACFDEPWSPENFLGELTRRLTVAMGLRDPSGALAAHCFFWLIPPEVHLLNLAVAPPYRGQGLARRLMTVMISMGRKAGADSFYLEVRRGNAAAIGLYRSLGFTRAGERPGYYENGEDALLMTLDMKPPEPVAGYGHKAG